MHTICLLAQVVILISWASNRFSLTDQDAESPLHPSVAQDRLEFQDGSESIDFDRQLSSDSSEDSWISDFTIQPMSKRSTSGIDPPESRKILAELKAHNPSTPFTPGFPVSECLLQLCRSQYAAGAENLVECLGNIPFEPYSIAVDDALACLQTNPRFTFTAARVLSIHTPDLRKACLWLFFSAWKADSTADFPRDCVYSA